MLHQHPHIHYHLCHGWRTLLLLPNAPYYGILLCPDNLKEKQFFSIFIYESCRTLSYCHYPHLLLRSVSCLKSLPLQMTFFHHGLCPMPKMDGYVGTRGICDPYNGNFFYSRHSRTNTANGRHEEKDNQATPM